ncbi:MAG: TetR/AcrR family transcriptional regulator [Anaerolineae bacterium]|jgi:AcrR family transcriptional regulator
MARPKKTEEEIEAARERILAATVELLKDQGPEALSMRAIAERVGMSHMALYTYFENRDALMASLRQRQRERMAARHAKIMERAESGDVCQVMREALAGYGRMADRWPRIYRFLWVEPVTHHDLLPHQSERTASHLRHLTELIALGISRGTFVDRDPQLAAAVVFSMVNGPLILHYGGRIPDRETKNAIFGEALDAAIGYLCEKDFAPPATRHTSLPAHGQQ